MMEEDRTDHQLLIAVRHPVRRSILRAMVGEEHISPRELARKVGQPLSNVSYHVRVLAKSGAVECVDQTLVRGSTQHFYAMRVDEPWALAMLGLHPEYEPEADAGENGNDGNS